MDKDTENEATLSNIFKLMIEFNKKLDKTDEKINNLDRNILETQHNIETFILETNNQFKLINDNSKDQLEYILSLDKSVKEIFEKIRKIEATQNENNFLVKKVQLEHQGLRTVITSIQISNQNLHNSINEIYNLLREPNENTKQLVEEKIAFVLEKISEIESALEGIKENIVRETEEFLKNLNKDILEVFETSVNELRVAANEFKKIQQNTEQNSKDILSVKQCLDDTQNKLDEMNKGIL